MAINSVERSDEIGAIQCAFDCGITSFDTAPIYANGEAEGLLGHALRGTRRDYVQIITKIHPCEASIKLTAMECESSLFRMGLDYIDLYLVHWRGPLPLEETVEALESLRSDGKIREWGVSNFDRTDILELLEIRKRDFPLVNQVLFNPIRREAESRLLSQDIGSVALMGYSPFERDRGLDITPFMAIAQRNGVTAHAVLLAWILSKGVSPVFKSTRADHIRANASALNITLAEDDIDTIEAYFPKPENPERIEREDTI
jgi:diketogulonate reductase-like aldo/keto reductase